MAAARLGSSAATHHPVQGVVLTPDPAASYELAVPDEHRLFVYVSAMRRASAGASSGAAASAGPDPVRGGASTSLGVAAADTREGASVLVYSGEPLRQPGALGGPFVMNVTRPAGTAC